MRVVVTFAVAATLAASAAMAEVGEGGPAPSPLLGDLKRELGGDDTPAPPELFRFELGRSCYVGETPTGDQTLLPRCYRPDENLMRRHIGEVREAAEAGSAYDQFVVGFVHWMGRRAPRDPVLALKWLSLAAENGLLAAQWAKEALADEMTPTEIAEAERLARAWREKRRQTE